MTFRIDFKAYDLADSCVEDLVERGVPAQIAADWGRAGGKRVGGLWRLCAESAGQSSSGQTPVGLNPVGSESAEAPADPVMFLWTVRRVVSSHFTIAGWTLADGAAALDLDVVKSILSGLVDTVIQGALGVEAPAVKAVSTSGDEVFAAVLQEAGFIAMPRPEFAATPEQLLAGETPVLGWMKVLSKDAFLLEAFAEAPKYERQQTDFTCGPTTALMAMDGGGLYLKSGVEEQMRMWRDATYTFGCGHAGVAMLMATRGFETSVRATVDGPVVGLKAPHAMVTAEIRRAIYDGHKDASVTAGATYAVGEVTEDFLDSELTAGKRVAVLVDLKELNGEDVPHWVLLWGMGQDDYIIHDPWYDGEFGETWVETSTQFIPKDIFVHVAAWAESDGSPHQAAVSVSR